MDITFPWRRIQDRYVNFTPSRRALILCRYSSKVKWYEEQSNTLNVLNHVISELDYICEQNIFPISLWNYIFNDAVNSCHAHTTAVFLCPWMRIWRSLISDDINWLPGKASPSLGLCNVPGDQAINRSFIVSKCPSSMQSESIVRIMREWIYVVMHNPKADFLSSQVICNY